MTQPDWKASLRSFFAERGKDVDGQATALENLCYVSGRDPRLWAKAAILDDLFDDIARRTAATSEGKVLEVGCAAGFIARGIAPRVRQYVGVDIAAPALRAAEQLGLPNAVFVLSEGENLPFVDRVFDGALCYDVFTNLPTIADGETIIREMLRVVKRGGKVLIGSIPDAALQSAYEARVAEFSSELEREFGPARPAPGRLNDHAPPEADPVIFGYYFKRDDFLALGEKLGARCEIADIHALNPYAGFRFNVIYSR